MSEKNREERLEEEKGGKGKLIVGIVVIVGFIIAVVLFLLLYHPEEEKSEEQSDKRPVLLTEDNVEEVFTPPTPTKIPERYNVTMNPTWNFKDGKSASEDAYVKNSTSNETAVWFDVVRNDTQETIYESPVIPLGGELENIVLDKDLDAGDYECTVTYHLIDENQETLSTVSVWLMVKVAG